MYIRYYGYQAVSSQVIYLLPVYVHNKTAQIAKNLPLGQPEYIHIIYNIQTSYNIGKNLYLNAYCYFKQSSVL